MRKITILLIVLMTVGVAVLSGCIGSNRSIKGTWKDTNDDIWEFGNNTVYIGVGSNNSYNYSIKNNKLYIEHWLEDDGYYTMNWINDEKLELSYQSVSGLSLTEILYRQ
ncbi:MAG: hypothetical protein MUO82_02170 [Candidatus Thermoplasmatota archaeon]|nr:hypothetical protein [Candidatus Thermoplasmatota archaeon]